MDAHPEDGLKQNLQYDVIALLYHKIKKREYEQNTKMMRNKPEKNLKQEGHK